METKRDIKKQLAYMLENKQEYLKNISEQELKRRIDLLKKDL